MNSSPPGIGTSPAKAALQALGKRIIENSTLYHFGKSDVPGGGMGHSSSPNVQLPPKKQKLDAKGTDKMKEEHNQRDPYLSYEQYENLLYRDSPYDENSTSSLTSISSLASPLPSTLLPSSLPSPPPALPSALPLNLHSTLPPNLQSPLHSTLPPSLASSLASSLGSSLNSSLSSSLETSIPTALPSPLTLSQPLSPIATSLSPTQPPHISTNHSPTQLALIPASVLMHAAPPPNAAHAVAVLTSAENQKIQRKKANQQEREVLEKYYNEHYIDQAVKIRKEDLTELAFNLNWHVLRVQGWMHTHRQSRSDYNPPKRTKRRATLPQEQDLLKHYFKLWTEQGLIDLNSPTRVTPKDYEIVAAQLGWDNERVRRWTDHYKQKIKAAAEGNA